MGALRSHAEHELAILRRVDPARLDGVDEAALLAQIDRDGEEFDSGGAMGFHTSRLPDGLLRTLLRFEPLTPLTGEPDEWVVHDYDDRLYAQNKRCGRVFQRRDGTAYDIDAVVFRDPDGSCWNTGDSARDVTFPYTPTTEIVDRTPEAASCA